MATESRNTLFGFPTPEEIRRRNMGLNEADAARAQMEPGRGMVAAASQAGRNLGGALGEYLGGTNPEIERARKLQEIVMRSRENAGGDTVSYLQGLGRNLAQEGFVNEAYEVVKRLGDLRYKSAGADALETQAGGSATERMLAQVPEPRRSELREMLLEGQARGSSTGSTYHPKNVTTTDMKVAKTLLKEYQGGKYDTLLGGDAKEAAVGFAANRARALMAAYKNRGAELSFADALNMAFESMEQEGMLGVNQRALLPDTVTFDPSPQREPTQEPATPSGGSKEVTRMVNGRPAIFNSETREFIRWAD